MSRDKAAHRWASEQVGKMPGGCPDGFWATSNCLYVQAVGLCRAPRRDRPIRPLRAPSRA